MFRKVLIFILLSSFTIFADEKKSIDIGTIFFKGDSSEYEDPYLAKKSLDDYAKIIENLIPKNINLHIYGYTAWFHGSDINPLKLSQSRANVVKKELVNRGIKEDRLKTEFATIGKGETDIWGDNFSNEGRRLNRRVTISVDYNEMQTSEKIDTIIDAIKEEKKRLEKERIQMETELESLQEKLVSLKNEIKENIERERLERERLEKERLERERLEKERLERERLEKEKLERERLEKEAEERPKNEENNQFEHIFKFTKNEISFIDKFYKGIWGFPIDDMKLSSLKYRQFILVGIVLAITGETIFLTGLISMIAILLYHEDYKNVIEIPPTYDNNGNIVNREADTYRTTYKKTAYILGGILMPTGAIIASLSAIPFLFSYYIATIYQKRTGKKLNLFDRVNFNISFVMGNDIFNGNENKLNMSITINL